MGRKPNPIINEYYERGQKLEDASNRYQHTCRSCGEKFPKGRIDTLINHLVKRCPCLSVQQRTEISLRAHEVPRSVSTPTKSTDSNHNITSDPLHDIEHGQSVDLGYTPAPKHQMSALETLAEVSRQQHLHLSGRPLAEQVNGGDGRQLSAQESGMQQAFVPEDFLVQDPQQQGSDTDNGVSRNGEDDWETWAFIQAHAFAVRNGSDIPTSNGLQPAHVYDEPPQSSSPHPTVSSAAPGAAPTAPMMQSPLEIAASAAQKLQAHMASNSNLTMEPEPTEQNGGISADSVADKFFGQRPNWASNIDPQLQQDDQAQNALADLLRNGVATHPRPIAMNPHQQQLPYPELNMTHTRQKPKVRGRFSDHRRKEVQDVRKRGACIRCRMLKKPCSGEDPCSTCVNVESARLWKSPCIRTRIAEEFNLYSTGLHAVLAFHDVNRAKALTAFEQSQGRFEATHFPDLGFSSTYQGVRSQKSAQSEVDPVLLAGSGVAADGSNLEMLDAEVDDISAKIERYSREFASTFFEREPSAFMKPTLLLAQRLAQEQSDTLLQRALELWTNTQILTDTAAPWHLFHNSTSNPQPDPVHVQYVSPENASEASFSSSQPLPPHSPSYRLISSQLAAMTEKHCATLCKGALNELEKRLLQRHYSSPFSTFLAAVILLACIERMAALFRGWEDPSAPLQPDSAIAHEMDPNLMHDTPMKNGPSPESLEHIPQSDREIAQQLLAASANPPLPSTPHSAPRSQPPITPTNGITLGNPDTDMTNGSLETPTSQSHLSPSSPFQPSPSQHTLPPDSIHHPTHHSTALPRYPLDRAPNFYVHQAERFADILYMLLKMRGLPPKTRPEPVTTPPSVPSPSATAAAMMVTSPPRRKLVPVESPTQQQQQVLTEADGRRVSGGGGGLVREWLESLGEGMEGGEVPPGGGVSAEWLRARAEAEWREGDARCWEGKWVARLLLGG
ncbi:MAG: hypothetical protein M1821_005553 [Bathelium mastoideum]|nr:MAG: hypothetical protein M1821_005553 [Bathelium mastoideum]